MSARKPFNGDAGYKASLRTWFGWVVIYDRENGGDWIDADSRWVVAAYDEDKMNLALLEARSEREARRVMKDTRDGWWEWIPALDKEADS